jgi:hypothetical protein
MRSAKAKKARGETLVGMILLAFGLLLLADAFWTGNRQYTILRTWPAVQAEVIGTDIGGGATDSSRRPFGRRYHTTINVRFNAGGDVFTASAIDESRNHEAASLTARAYAAGTRHSIRYNPSNPNDIRIHSDDLIGFFSTPLWFGAIGAAVLFLGLNWLWR